MGDRGAGIGGGTCGSGLAAGSASGICGPVSAPEARLQFGRSRSLATALIASTRLTRGLPASYDKRRLLPCANWDSRPKRDVQMESDQTLKPKASTA